MGKRSTALHVLLLVSSLSLGACGGGGSGDDASSPDATILDAAPPDAPAAVTEADICGTDGAYVQLIDKLLTCNPALDVFVQGRATAQRIAAACDGAIGPYLGDGTIALPTRDQLNACLDYLSSVACADFDLANTAGGPCDIFFGQVADSGDCDTTEQCGEVSYCDHSGAGACGSCTPRAADGLACTADEQCANGACVGTQCGHLGDVGDPCFEDADCLGARVCDLQTNQCAAPPTWVVNQACDPSGNDCDPFTTGLYCKGITANTGQCSPFLTLDTACRTNGTATGICDVRSYDYCPAGANAVCTPPMLVTTEGQPCGMLAGQKCDTGMVCAPSPFQNGTCVAYQQAGETCSNSGTASEQCDLFLGCLDDGTGATTCQYGDYTGSCPLP